ncbi:MAG: HNH endonuclease, partial [Deltaproteobacteria bacterium]|nr:HNH endonuclease [Deltaproteobacteria bacterium]
CSYTSPEGKKCAEKNFLELDHVQPWSLGGSTTADNLRLLCRTHNQWRSQKTFRWERDPMQAQP